MEGVEAGAVRQLQALLRIGQVARGASREDALAAIAAILGESLGFATVAVNLYRPAWDDLPVVAVHGSAAARAAIEHTATPRSSWEGLLDDRHLNRGAYDLRHGEHEWGLDDVATYVPPAGAGTGPDPWHPDDALFVTMTDSRGALLGVLSVDEPVSGCRPTDTELDILVAAAAYVGAAVEQVQASEANGRLRAATRTLLEVSSTLNSGRSTQEVLSEVCQGIRRALGFEIVATYLLDRDGFFRARSSVGHTTGTGPLEAAYPRAAIEALTAPELQKEGCVLLDGPTVERLAPEGTPRTYRSTMNGEGPRAWRNHWLMVPLTNEAGTLTGIIGADDPSDRLLPTRARLQALRLFADQAMSALEAAGRLERMRELAERDPLTALANRRALEAFLAGSDADEMALLVCDLDHFKRINDQLGHDAGDETLVAFARLLERLVRTSDLAVRLGGEEFALVLPGADAATGLALAQELLRATRESFSRLPHGLTVSVGIAAGTQPTNLLREADRALSVAKRSGRDRAVVHHAETIDALLAELTVPGGSGDQLGAVLLLAETLDLRDDATARHSRTVGGYAELTGRRLELDPQRVERLRIAGVLHDVGKVGISDAILRKPSQLDAAEWSEMRRHPELGARILANAGLADVAAWVLAHHERLDGGGYPSGLPGSEIPLEARVLAVVDAYEAMTAGRPYRSALTAEQAAAELARCTGTQFDPDVVAAFLATVGEQAPPAFVAA